MCIRDRYINNFENLKFDFELNDVDRKIIDEANVCFEKTSELIEKVELKSSLQSVMGYVNKINAYLNETEPWKVIKEDITRATAILYTSLTAIEACASLFTPFMPTTSEIVKNAIEKNTNNNWSVNDIKKGAPLQDIGHLFKKFD